MRNELKNKENECLDVEEAMNLSEFFKIFGDSTRIKIISILTYKRLCVYDICEILNMSQSSISHQLKILRDAKVVRYIKEGKNVYYELKDNHVKSIYEMGREHVNEK